MTELPVTKDVVIAVCGSEKKHRQSFDKLQQYITEKSVGSTSNSSSSNTCGSNKDISFSIVTMNYDDIQGRFSLDSAKDIDIDVILHKVSTLPPKATSAFLRWCAAASRERRRHRLPSIIIIDPIEVTRLVLRRSFIYKLLDGRLKRPLCPTPRSWLWARGGNSLTPLGFSSFLLHGGEENNNNNNKNINKVEAWWIVKPDLSTGPPVTHHMIIWRGPQPVGKLPQKVQEILPKEVESFVLQEFLASAAPAIIKVYCIGSNVFVKAVSTRPLLQRVLTDAGEAVFINSQEKFPLEESWKEESVRWANFLAEGGRAHTLCTQIAAQLAEELKLTLFGFDLLLIPGEMYRRGSILLDATISESETAAANTNNNTASLQHSLLFDESTGAPTPSLNSAVPVLIDVNYFPGFAGVENASKHLLEVIKSKLLGISNLPGRKIKEKENTLFCC